ncbi:hypothetical protein BDZ91DRAFT_712846 [Kalaharituber pfeilii]|nr:hypothetical protein BDZ91DRAFT_712846 [Kalaharituber pfeilii]
MQARWGILFNAYNALGLVDKIDEGEMLRVKYSEKWQTQRGMTSSLYNQEYVRPFD